MNTITVTDQDVLDAINMDITLTERQLRAHIIAVRRMHPSQNALPAIEQTAVLERRLQGLYEERSRFTQPAQTL